MLLTNAYLCLKDNIQMIQRIQSIFFLLAAGCFGGEFATSFASTNKSVNGLFNDQVYNLQDHIGLQIIVGLGLVLSLVAIFLYKNRDNQIKLGYVIATLAILLPIAAILIYMGQSEGLETVEVNDDLGLYLPVGMILFTLLAVRFVKKDNQLVQSMDRLR